MRSCALLLLSAAACGGIEVLERGECGNNILEPTEDCDGAPYCNTSCGIPCANDSDCMNFPGYACGNDKECHAPGGAFAPPATADITATEIQIGDVDRDRTNDVIAIGTSSLATLFGDPSASLARTAVVTTPSIEGAAATLVPAPTEDDPVRVVIPMADGIVSYSSEFGTLAAEPFPADLAGDPATILAVIAFDTPQPDRKLQTRLGIFSSEPEPTADTLVFKAVDVIEGDRPQDEFALCGARGDHFDPAMVDTYSIVTPGRVELVSVAVLESPARFCAWSTVYAEAADTYTFTNLAVGIAPDAKRPILIDLTDDGNACPSLLLGEQSGSAFTYLPGVLANSSCGFDSSPQTIVLDAADEVDPAAVAVGRLRLEPPLANAGPDALVLDAGVFEVIGGSATLLHRAQRPIASIVAADLDRDGQLDAITTTPGAPDLEVLMRAPPVVAEDGFLPIRVPTLGVASQLVVGDFDGNAFDDIVFVERVGSSDRLLVAFGTPDRLLEPIHVASFDTVLGMAIANVRDSTDPIAAVHDLAVLDNVRNAPQPHRVTALHGSPNRTLTPVFTPGLVPVLFHAVIAGELGDTEGGGVGVDLLALDRGSRGDMWRLLAEGVGFHNEDKAIENPIECPSDVVCSIARYAIIDREVVVLDAFGKLAKFDPAPTNCEDVGLPHDVCDPASTPTPTTITQSPVEPRAPLAFDVDGDGSTEIVIAYASTDGGDVQVCDQSLACTPMTPLIATIDPEITSCVDAAPGTLVAGGRDRPAPAKQLVALCRTQDETRLFRIEATDRAFRVDGFGGNRAARRLVIGDVTGDDVDDVVLLLETDEGVTSIEVVRQLTSREAASQ